MKNHFQNIRKGLEDHTQRLYGNMVQGLKSFSESPGKHTVQLGKDYWDLALTGLTTYLFMKQCIKQGAESDSVTKLITNPDYLATLGAWLGSMNLPRIFNLEKNKRANHFRAIRNGMMGFGSAIYFIYSPPFNWLLGSGFGASSMFSEHLRRWERKRASETSEPEQKPKNLENTINQNS